MCWMDSVANVRSHASDGPQFVPPKEEIEQNQVVPSKQPDQPLWDLECFWVVALVSPASALPCLLWQQTSPNGCALRGSLGEMGA